MTDLSAKNLQKFKSQNQNLKGFQRDRWIRAPSVFVCVSNVFATLAKSASHGTIQDSHNHVWKFWVGVWYRWWWWWEGPPPKDGIFGTFDSWSLQRHPRLVMRLHEQLPSSTLRSKSASRSWPTFHFLLKIHQFETGFIRVLHKQNWLLRNRVFRWVYKVFDIAIPHVLKR